ncbi:small ribosomal subunit protein mS34-like [Lineus longissimus]|uniref:small ribosomal subunit protein mS34-like n=1 Tax=Lineus longissimus TaxID=88925 RepID=UPI002B4E2B86
MSIQYIGRSAGIYYGKTLYEILCQLKNFGVGRMVIRESFYNRYPEPSYYTITKSTPDMSDKTLRHGRAFAKRVFRGVKIPEEERITTGYKPDWRLIHKDEEAEIKKQDAPKREPRIIPKEVDYPPLLGRMLMQEMNLLTPPKMEIVPRESVLNLYVREDRTDQLPILFPELVKSSESIGKSSET